MGQKKHTLTLKKRKKTLYEPACLPLKNLVVREHPVNKGALYAVRPLKALKHIHYAGFTGTEEEIQTLPHHNHYAVHINKNMYVCPLEAPKSALDVPGNGKCIACKINEPSEHETANAELVTYPPYEKVYVRLKRDIKADEEIMAHYGEYFPRDYVAGAP